VVHRPYARIDNGLIRSAPFNESTRRRRSCAGARSRSRKPTDFVEGIVTLGGNGDVATQVGMASTSMPPTAR
jgi:homogentisate 1,2-dioxygenase